MLMLSLLLAGCGKSADNSGDNQSGGEQEEAKLRVALLLPGTINDQGWNATAYTGLMMIKDDLGADVAYTEKVAQSDMEEVFRGYAAQGYGIIFGHGFEFGDAAMKVAKEFPDVKFVVTSTDIHQAPNVASLRADNLEQGFLQGVAAAVVTKTGVVGAVGGMDIPPITDALKGFEAGAKYINPNVKVMTALTGDFDDAAKAKESAFSMIEKGADVVMQDADQAGLGVIEACKAKGVMAIGSIGDQNSAAPDTVVVSGMANLPLAFEKMVGLIQSGEWQPQYYNMGVKEGVISLSPYYSFEDKLTQEQKDQIQQVVDDIMTGKLNTAEKTAELVK